MASTRPRLAQLYSTLIEYAAPSTTDGTLVFRWGVNAYGQPYFDSAGVTVGDEAALHVRNADGIYYVEEITP